MPKKTSKKDPYAVEVGARLRNIIDAFYGNQTKFANVVNMNLSVLSAYLTGNMLISEKTADNLQRKTGINKDYLFNGNAPMMLTDDIKPLKDYNKLIATVVGKLEQNRKETTAHQGVIPNLIMSREGLKSEIANRGEFNVIGIVVNGIENPQAVEIRDEIFVNMYNTICPLLLNCHLIISPSFSDGDIVLIKYAREHRIAVLNDKKYYEVITGTEIDIIDEDIVGKIYSIVIKFELKDLVIGLN